MADNLLIPWSGRRITNASGTPQSGALVYIYLEDTTTLATIYSDRDLTVPLSNPVTCDSGGLVPQIYIGVVPYKIKITTSGGTTIDEQDDLPGALDTSTFDDVPTFTTAVVAKTADYTILTTDQNKLIQANPTGGAFTLTLPSAVTAGDGWQVTARHNGPSSTNTVGWATVSSQTVAIYGGTATSGTLSESAHEITFVSDGANWVGHEVRPPITRDDFGFTVTSSLNALTVSLKNSDGDDPSEKAPVKFYFRSATVTAGTISSVEVNAATSLVLSSGSTLGFANSTAGRVWIVGFNDGGTFRLGAINCRGSTGIYPLSEEGVASSTAEGGAGGADSAEVFYTGTAVTSKAYRVLGYLDWSSGLTTAGSWNAVPTQIQVWSKGLKLPGDIVQVRYLNDTSYTTGSTQIPSDDTLPQNTEGFQVMSLAITPKASANVLTHTHRLGIMASSAGTQLTAALFQDSTASAVAVVMSEITGANSLTAMTIDYVMVAGTTSATTFAIRIGGNGGGTVEFGGRAGSALMSTAIHSNMRILEIQG